MQFTLDTLASLGISVTIAAVSLSAFSQVDPGDPLRNWRDGRYQRDFEDRFATALPTRKPAASVWSAARWVLWGEAAAGAVVGRDGWLFTAEEFTDPSHTRALQTELARAHETLSARGITLLPVIVPDKARMMVDRLPRARSNGFAQRYDRALRVIRDGAYPVVDLRPALSRQGSYMRTDTHWSPEGAKRSAEAIAAALAGIALPQSVVHTEVLGSAAFQGDLLAFVPTGALQPLVGPKTESIATFRTDLSGASALFGNAHTPVALIGTSFSAKPAFHFEGFLKQALQSDVLNLSTVGQGPFVPMDRFLKGVDTLSSPPSLVTWEIPERYLTSRSPSP